MRHDEPRDDRHGERGDALTLRLGAVALPLGVLAPLVATAIHPHREDPVDTPVVLAAPSTLLTASPAVR